MAVPTKQIHNGYNNILSYPLEHDDKIYIFSRRDLRNGLRLQAALKVDLPWDDERSYVHTLSRKLHVIAARPSERKARLLVESNCQVIV
jgi:hypothetical protein